MGKIVHCDLYALAQLLRCEIQIDLGPRVRLKSGSLHSVLCEFRIGPFKFRVCFGNNQLFSFFFLPKFYSSKVVLIFKIRRVRLKNYACHAHFSFDV